MKKRVGFGASGWLGVLWTAVSCRLSCIVVSSRESDRLRRTWLELYYLFVTGGQPLTHTHTTHTLKCLLWGAVAGYRELVRV